MLNFLKKKYLPLDLLLFSAFLFLFVAPLFQQGLFIDGLLYKTVANNYFRGEGEFWSMKFSDVTMTPFYEQPPLFFAVTAYFYHLFGNSFLADKFLTLLMLIGVVVVLKKVNRLLSNEPLMHRVSLLFFLGIPVIAWSFANQVIETQVALLSLLGYMFFLLSRGTGSFLIYVFAFSIIGIGLFLTKGFQSCFVLIVPFAYAFSFKNSRDLLFGVLSSLIFLSLLYYFLRVNEASKSWFDNYYSKRLMASLNGVGATTTWRLEIVFRLFTEMLFPLLVILAVWIYAKKKKIVKRSGLHQKHALALLITGLAGSLPYVITLEQRGFYLVPSFAFFILALVVFFQHEISSLFIVYEQQLHRKMVEYVLLATSVLSVIYLLASPFLFKRDENLIHDVAIISKYVEAHDTVAIDEDMWNDTPLQSYLYMQKQCNVEAGVDKTYYIHDRSHPTDPDPSYVKLPVPTRQYDLYKGK